MDEDYNFDVNLEDEPTVTTKKTHSRKKAIVVLLILIIALGVVTWFMLRPKNSSSTTEVTNAPLQADTPNKENIRLIATGDMIPHDAINSAAKQSDGSYNYDSMFGDTKKWFEMSDIRFCNQPTLAGGVEYGVTGYPAFNAPLEFTKALHKQGCNLITLGSNHTNDKPQEVINATIDGWKGLSGVLATGGANKSEAEKAKVRYFDVEGVRFAFLAYTTYTNESGQTNYGVTMYDDALAAEQIKEANKKADVVVVSMRWGTEYSPVVNSSQKALAKKLAGMNVDVILGHGPHVLQANEVIGGTIVWYSLGNYFNAQLDAESLFNGIAVMDVSSKDKKVSLVGYLPIYMHYEWTAEQKKREDLLARKNFTMYTFDDAEAHIADSQLKTSVDEQRARIEETLNTYTKTSLLTPQEYLSN